MGSLTNMSKFRGKEISTLEYTDSSSMGTMRGNEKVSRNMNDDSAITEVAVSM